MNNHKHNYTDETVDEEGNETCEYCGASRFTDVDYKRAKKANRK